MVLFVDLEDETEPPELQGKNRWSMHDSTGSLKSLSIGKSRVGIEAGLIRDNPNKNAVTEALACYPIITSIASHIDLNTLDALARTCRQVRVNLLQFKTHLLTSTLHCENEEVELDPEHTFRYRARAADWYFVDTGRDTSSTGKVGDCARDMVGGCRRCARVVCRNCTIKPPAPVLLRHRHRRICKACSRAPLTALTSPTPPTPSHEGSQTPKLASTELTNESICACPTGGVWLCQPCGRSLRSADNEYESIWKWRTRYLPSLGGLGVGIGEGNRGVPCGRGGECIAAREVEQEVDCDAEDARESDRDSRAGSPSSSSGGSASGSTYSGVTGNREMLGPGYKRHEIEGIGGVIKNKLVQMVKVGACVSEFEDEKGLGKFLVREVEGRSRSWCGWCWRPIPGVKDLIE